MDRQQPSPEIVYSSLQKKRKAASTSVFIFDMDGVLIDSNPHHRAAWEAFNRRYGLETTTEMHERMYGKRNDEIIRDFYGSALSDAETYSRGAAKEALYREMVSDKVETLLVAGLREFLERYDDIPMAIASNAEPENVNFLLDRAALRSYFEVILNGHQVSHPKPHPEIYLLAAKRLGANPADCIVFEDSYSGVAAARAAGMPVIGLSTTHGYLPETELTVDNFLDWDLKSWLNSRLGVS